MPRVAHLEGHVEDVMPQPPQPTLQRCAHASARSDKNMRTQACACVRARRFSNEAGTYHAKEWKRQHRVRLERLQSLRPAQ